MSRRLSVAAHEAAHVTVGVTLGLRLHSACTRPVGGWLGFSWFWSPPCGGRVAMACMYAAGVAWERSPRSWGAESDYRHARRLAHGLHGAQACVRAAAAILETRGAVHEQLTRLLCERQIHADDVTAIIEGTGHDEEDTA